MAEREKNKFQSARKLLINAELYGLVLLAPRLKKVVGQFATQKSSKLAPRFFGPDS
jgi:hypothetical protein